ncbi:hypothetical protein GC169_09470 [bacterium]|nr:hypothetical protein [bacterium]
MFRNKLRRELRRRLSHVRVLKELKRPAPRPAKAAAVVAGLDNDALCFAAQNPEHSEAGRAIALEQLVARVGAEAAEKGMDDFVNGLPTPGFLHDRDVARSDWVFFGLGRWLRMALGFSAVVASILFVIGIMGAPAEDQAFRNAITAGLVTEEEFQTYKDMSSVTAEFVENEERRAQTMGRARAIIAPDDPSSVAEPTSDAVRIALRTREGMDEPFKYYDQYSSWNGQMLMWAWLLFPVWAFVTGLRQKPARILLLRKFNNKEVGKSLEKMSKKNLRPYGHVFTLADKHFKRNWVLAFLSTFWASPFTLMQRCITVPIGFFRRFWDRSRDGPILIWNTRDFRNFAKRFEDRSGLNLEMARTQRKAVMIRTSDDWWKHVVELLMHAVDVIVIDLTEVAGGTVWELHKVLSEDVKERVVLVARDDRIEHAREQLREHGYADSVDHVLGYSPHGKFTDKKAFRAEMLDAQRRRLAADKARAAAQPSMAAGPVFGAASPAPTAGA